MDFTKPTTLSDRDVAFGPRNVYDLLPTYASLPDEFKRGNGWEQIVRRWFFNGLPKDTKFVPKDGVDVDAALRHVSTCLRSRQPKHEHKTAGCAYLLSLWFERIDIPAARAASGSGSEP